MSNSLAIAERPDIISEAARSIVKPISRVYGPDSDAAGITPTSNIRRYPLRYHPEQARLWASPSRFRVVPAGRRSGKTELAKRKLVLQAFRGTPFADPRFFAAAPTRDQAKRIYWEDLKQMVPRHLMAGDPIESALIINFINGAMIQVVGMDKPERIEGSPWDGGILDEYGNMKKQTWGEHVRPALSDRLGWCWLIGVPEGRNHYFTSWQVAGINKARDEEQGQPPEWDRFTWYSADILPASEIAAARRDLDELTYQQEYEASFVHFSGMAYYPFREATHCRRLFQEYNPRAPLIFMFDFNVAPGVAAVGQEMRLPNDQPEEIIEDGQKKFNELCVGTGIIGEVHIKRGSNTEMVCRRLHADWKNHQGPIYCYGDATGGAKGSAKVLGSDWDLIKGEMSKNFGEAQMQYRVRRKNPSERARVNAVNSRLKSQAGVIRLMIDQSRAPKTVHDFEGTVTVEGGSGEIDKKSDPELTHLSDSVGYYVEREYPVRSHEARATKIGGS